MLRFCQNITSLKAVLMILFSAVLLLSVPVSSYAAQNEVTKTYPIHSSAFVQSDTMTVSDQRFTEEIADTFQHSDCADPLCGEVMDCIDNCCDGICHSFLVITEYDLSRMLSTQPNDLANESLNNISFAPLPFPPKT